MRRRPRQRGLLRRRPGHDRRDPDPRVRRCVGYGVPPMPDFWIGPRTTGEGFRESHLAFSAPDRAAVRAFFEAGTAANAEVLHEPRVWPEYHANYYGGFVRDPDGNNVEAVCHTPE